MANIEIDKFPKCFIINIYINLQSKSYVKF